MLRKMLLHLPLAVALGMALAPAPALAHVSGEVQLMTAGSGPWVEHTIRHGAGNWDRFNRLGTGTDAAPSSLASAIVNGELYLVYNLPLASDPSNSATHLRIRHADGHWSNLATPFVNAAGSNAVAAVNGELHVVQQASLSGVLRHSVRRTDGSWSPAKDVPLSSWKDFAAVATDGTLEVMAIDGVRLVSTTLRTDGTWSPATETTQIGFFANTVNLARVGPDLHAVVKLSHVGGLTHAIRRSTGQWTGWGSVDRQTGMTSYVTSVGVTASQNTLHLAVTTSDGGLLHTIRFEDGHWQPAGDVRGQAGGTTSHDVVIAGD